LNFAADQRYDGAQFKFALGLRNGEGVSTDLKGAGDCLKLGVDQRNANADAQLKHGLCLQNGECVGINFKGVAHYFKLAADRGFADVQFNYGLCLWNRRNIVRSEKP
jgi:TPR repeat protein